MHKMLEASLRDLLLVTNQDTTQAVPNLCRDQRLYKASLGSETCDIQPITPEDSKLRFADAIVDEQRNRLIAVCEDHSQGGEAVNTVSAVGQLIAFSPHAACM